MLDVMQCPCRGRRVVERLDRPRRGPSSDGGFTLIEVVVVLMLIGLLAVIGVPNLIRAKVRANMLSQIKMTQQAFAVSRINAIKSGRSVALAIETVGGGRALVAWVDENENEVHDGTERNLGTWIYPEQFDVAEDGSMQFYRLQSRLGGSGPAGALFLPSGSVIVASGTTSPTGQAAVVIGDNVGNQMRLRVLSGTGTAVQEMRDPASGDWDPHSTKYWKY